MIDWIKFNMYESEELEGKTYLILANGLTHQAKFDADHGWFFHEGYEESTIYFQRTVSHYAYFNYPKDWEEA
jgi:hypothetical protein